jgi:hypothetical protein
MPNLKQIRIVDTGEHPQVFLPKFAPVQKQGRVAEWLGRGLQNLVQRFESARDLKAIASRHESVGFFIWLMKRQLAGAFRKANKKVERSEVTQLV